MKFPLTRRAALAGTAAALGGRALAQDAANGPAVIYTSNPAQAVDAVTEVGRKAIPNIKLSTITGGTPRLMEASSIASGRLCKVADALRVPKGKRRTT